MAQSEVNVNLSVRAPSRRIFARRVTSGRYTGWWGAYLLRPGQRRPYSFDEPVAIALTCGRAIDYAVTGYRIPVLAPSESFTVKPVNITIP